MSVDNNEEERKLSENANPSCESMNEEEQGLLRGWKEEQEGAEAHDEETVSQKRLRSWDTKIWEAVACIVIGAVLLSIASVLILSCVRSAPSEDLSAVHHDDYILDPNWDIHAQPLRREFTWTIRDHMHNPDGVYRPMMLVNNQYPGPLIEANEGDSIVVHVDNQAINATAIHWHGIYQNGTPHMDGTVGVTQCPIHPGGKFTYEFKVAGQSAGTYWWHAHSGAVQSSDGLHGPFILHSKDERKTQKIEYATDRVFLISDHYHDLSSALLWQYLKPGMENAEPVPDGALINGRAIKNCDDYRHRKCDNRTSLVGLPIIPLASEQNHRLRFINVGAFAEFQVQIDEHELAVTEVDGTDVVPVTYHRVNISPAQRYSVVVKASVSGTENFWLRARMITKCFTDPPRNLQSEVRGIVRYSSTNSAGANEIPVSADWQEKLDLECKDMIASDLRPVEATSVSARPDSFFYLRSNFEIGAYRLSRGFFNTSSWRPNVRSPTLQRSIDAMATGNTSFMPTSFSLPENGAAFVNDAAFEISRELVIQTTGIQTIDLLVSNFDDGNHPLHLHGYKYFVLAQGHGYPPLTDIGSGITLKNLAPLYNSLNLSNPLRRDTASVEAFGWILLRIVADNPGVWAFHCHLSWHSEAGLLMQFLTRSDELAAMKLPKASLELCTAEGVEKGMIPEDASYEDLAK